MNILNKINSINSNIIDVSNKNNYNIHLDNPENIKTSFLQLLKTKIQNKNLIEPEKKNELMNRFSHTHTLKEMKELYDTLNNSVKEIDNNSLLNISSLVGHNVLIPSSKIHHVKDTKVIYGYFLPENTHSTLIQIKNKEHQLVFSHQMGPQKTGHYIYYWDGKIDQDNTIDSGRYNISIRINDESGASIIQPLVQAIVYNITKNPNSKEYMLDLGKSGEVGIEDIKRIF